MKEPVEIKKNIRLCNHPVEFTITESNHHTLYLNDEMLNFKIMDDIVAQLKAGRDRGEFKAKTRVAEPDGSRGVTVKVKGYWRIRLDYMLFYRIFRWWYTCNIDPQRVESLFREAFGHNCESCMEAFEKTCERNIFDFIGYIGDMQNYGFAFMDIITREMEAYEARYSLFLNKPQETPFDISLKPYDGT